MKNEKLAARLKAASSNILTSRSRNFISPNGRNTYEIYNAELGRTFTIHVCETREDVEASREDRW